MFLLLYTLFFYYLWTVLILFLIKKANIVNDAATHMSKTFTRHVLCRYIKTRTWSIVHLPSLRKNKYVLSLFIIINNSKINEENSQERECLVCYNEENNKNAKTIIAHKCYRCSFTMCTNCERRVHNFLCPLCECVLCNAQIEEFVKKYVHYETRKVHFVLILLVTALVIVQFKLSSSFE